MLNYIWRLLLDNAEDQAQEVNEQYIKTGAKNRSTTLKIRKAIERILEEHKRGKVGKSVQPDVRLKCKDYRKYKTMYLVYRTTSEAYIKHYETYFIDAFRSLLDNKHSVSNGRVAKIEGMYYLYVVV